jgi:MGT family glycosyltransferase
VGKTIFFNIPATGHINPSLAVVMELVKRGEQVIYVNTEDTRGQVEGTGAEFRPYPSTPELIETSSSASGGKLANNALALVQIAEKLLPFVFDLLKAEKPDYVIYDSLCSWAKQAAGALRIPSVAQIATFAIGPGAMPPVSPGMMLEMLGSFVPVMPRLMRVSGRMRQQYGVKGVGPTEALMNTADLNIVYTSPEFQPASEKFPKNFRFVGPSFNGARADSVDFPFDLLTRRPLVYISLGTINNANLEFYRQCFAAFADHPGQFILSAGKRTDLKALGDIPANFIVRNYVPQLELLQKVDLFITHGGLNSVNEGLYYGVPLVAIPQQIEQALVAMQIEKHHAGLAVGTRPPYGKVSAAELRAVVDRILGDPLPYQTGAKQLGDSFRNAGGYKRAAAEILQFAARK